MTSMKIRVYGPVIGNGSFAVVTRGIVGALKELGLFAGLYPIDADPDDFADSAGFDADVGVLIGPPHRSALLMSAGDHKHRLLMLVPNSTWLPKEVVALAMDNVTGFVTPSEWARVQIEHHLDTQQTKKVPVYLWPHGVDAAFKPDSAQHDGLARRFQAGDFHVAHFTSTSFQRKGTHELIDAWKLLFDSLQWSGDHATLTVVAETPEVYAATAATVPGINVVSRGNHHAAHMATILQSFHAIVQPSRGEGFGLVPLEARACGIPTVVTWSTGHAQHVPDPRWSLDVGVVHIGRWSPHPPMRTIDDGPGAMAPLVTKEDIAAALFAARKNWTYLATHAFSNAWDVGRAWSWASQTRTFIDVFYQDVCHQRGT